MGELTTDGVTVFSNQQTTEEMQQAAPVETPVAETPEKPVVGAAPEKKPNPRKDLAARVEQLSGELANKDQSISALNQRLAEIDTLKREIADLKRAPVAAEPEKQQVKALEVDWAGFTDVAPKEEDFLDQPDPYRALLRAEAAYDRRKEAYGERQLQQRTQAQTAREREFVSRSDAFSARMAEVQKADAEFSTAIDALLTAHGNPPMPPPVFEVLTEAEVGPQLFRYLLEHPTDYRAVLALPTPKAQFGAMKKLEARVEAAVSTGSAPPVRKTSQAQPPIHPVSGATPTPADGPPDPKTCTQAEYDAYWNRQERESKRA